MTHAEMIATYHAHSAATRYALGFTVKGTLYNVFLTWEELTRYFRADRMSSNRGGWAKIRIRLSKADRMELMTRATKVGAEADLHADTAHNAGENFERVITESYTTGRWVKDSVPFWVAGDVEINGEQVQVKLDGAELTNERTLARMLGLA